MRLGNKKDCMVWIEFREALLAEFQLERVRQINFLGEMEDGLCRFLSENYAELSVEQNTEVAKMFIYLKRKKNLLMRKNYLLHRNENGSK